MRNILLPPGFKDSRGDIVEHAATERTTFVIRPDSRIAVTLSSADDNIGPIDHVDQSLEMARELAAMK